MVVLRVGIRSLPLRDGKTHPFNALEHYFICTKALLLNRIQNIVVPSRRPPLHHTYSAHDLRSHWVLRMILPSIFPIDLSSTYSRMVLRLPSMYFIFKSLVLWSILALQASDYLSSTTWKPLQWLDNWAARKEMDEICWSTFLAICGALCVGALTRGLEGVGNTNAAPFNLVCSFYSALNLHFFDQALIEVWLFIHAALLCLTADPSSKTRRTTFPSRCECHSHPFRTPVPGKKPHLGHDAADIVPAFNDPLHRDKAELVQSAANTNDYLFHANPHSFSLGSLVLTNCVPATQLRVLYL